jgi:hypothetical protein
MQTMSEAQLIIDQITKANSGKKAKAIIGRFIAADDAGLSKWTRDARYVWEQAYNALQPKP